MSTVTPGAVVVPPHVDHVLDEVGRQLQITRTQFDRAARAYEAVGTWLRKDGSTLAPYAPEVYPQGSMALRTTVRPLDGEEFDLDLVAEMGGWEKDAMDLHQALGARLAEHGEYAKILEKKKRCWTLNYAGEFHLDALPGRDDPDRPGSAIQVPDRTTEGWKPSNPRDYVAWFEERARPYYRALEERQQDPLPEPDPVDASDPLRRAVQLMKRHRDVRFVGGPDNAPRSIVLTTLAAKHYDGRQSVGEALLGMLVGINAELGASDGPLVVPNPVNSDENFAESWEENPTAYDEFVDYVEQFGADLRELITTPMGDEFRERSGGLFGVEVAKRAVGVYQETRGAPAVAALTRIARGSDREPSRPWSSA